MSMSSFPFKSYEQLKHDYFANIKKAVEDKYNPKKKEEEKNLAPEVRLDIPQDVATLSEPAETLDEKIDTLEEDHVPKWRREQLEKIEKKFSLLDNSAKMADEMKSHVIYGLYDEIQQEILNSFWVKVKYRAMLSELFSGLEKEFHGKDPVTGKVIAMDKATHELIAKEYKFYQSREELIRDFNESHAITKPRQYQLETATRKLNRMLGGLVPHFENPEPDKDPEVIIKSGIALVAAHIKKSNPERIGLLKLSHAKNNHYDHFVTDAEKKEEAEWIQNAAAEVAAQKAAAEKAIADAVTQKAKAEEERAKAEKAAAEVRAAEAQRAKEDKAEAQKAKGEHSYLNYAKTKIGMLFATKSEAYQTKDPAPTAENKEEQKHEQTVTRTMSR